MYKLPLGLVVEGHGEHNCAPSLVNRIIGGSNLHVPTINARGIDNIINYLPEQLTDLCMSHTPRQILVCLDLADCQSKQRYGKIECYEICNDLLQKCNNWLQNAATDKRVLLPPVGVSVIVQIPKLESWFTADVNGLKRSGLFSINDAQCKNCDLEILNPTSWLKERACGTYNLKNQEFTRNLIANLDVDIMSSNSQSFNKFMRDIRGSYECWLNSLN